MFFTNFVSQFTISYYLCSNPRRYVSPFNRIFCINLYRTYIYYGTANSRTAGKATAYLAL